MPYGDGETFAEEVCGYGPDVVVDRPADVRGLVVARLRHAIAAQAGGAA